MRIRLLLFMVYLSCVNGFGIKFRFNSGANLLSSLPKLQVPVVLPLVTAVDRGAGTILTPPPSNNMGLVHSHSGGSNNILVNFVAAANHTMSGRLANVTANIHRIPHVGSSEVFTYIKTILKFVLRTTLLLLPWLAQHVSTVFAALPLVLERAAQYINPSLAALTAWSLIQTPQRAQWLYSVFLASTGIGLLFLCCDQLLCGAHWTGLAGEPAEDAVAVVTGAQDGLGMELARRLSGAGYNMVLVGDDLQQLQELRHALLHPQEAEGDSGLHPRRAGGSVDAAPLWREAVRQASALHRTAMNLVSDKISKLLKENSTMAVPTAAVAPKQSWYAWPYSSRAGAGRSGQLAPKESNTQNKNVFRIPYNSSNVFRESALRPGIFTMHDDAYNETRTETPPHRQPATVHIVHADLAQRGAAHSVLWELQRLHVDDKVEVLVHAAQHRAVGAVSTARELDLADTVQVNVFSAVTLTRLLLPQMINRCNPNKSSSSTTSAEVGGSASPLRASVSSSGSGGRRQRAGGRILFLGAESECGPAPSTAVFAASAAFLSSFAQSLRRELLPQGVLVTMAHTGTLRSDKTPILPLPTASSPPSPAPPLLSELLDTGISGGDVAQTDYVPPPTYTGAEGTNRDRHTDPIPARLPVLAHIPGSRMHVEVAAQKIFAALNTGRDVTRLGILNRLNRHGLAHLLPAPALALLHQLAWSPAPQSQWRLPAALPRPHLPSLSVLLPRAPPQPR